MYAFSFLGMIFFLLFNSSITFCQDKKDASDSGSEREKFLRQFAKDPDAIKEDKKPAAEAANTNDVAGKKGKEVENIEAALKKFRQQANNVIKDDEFDEGDIKQAFDPEQIKKLQKLMPGNLLDKMKAGSQGDGKKVSEELDKENSDYSVVVYQMLHFFRSQSQADVELIFREKFNRGVLGSLFKIHPGLVTLLAKIVRDPKALPDAAKIGNEKKKMGLYFGLIVATFILGFTLKKMSHNKHGDMGMFFFMNRFIMRSLFLYGLRFAAFIYIFNQELAPLGTILKAHFF